MSAVVLATAGYDHKIRFWEASREKCTRVIKYPDSQVNALAITNDKQHIAAAGNPHAKIFDVHRGEGLPVRSYDAHLVRDVAKAQRQTRPLGCLHSRHTYHK